MDHFTEATQSYVNAVLQFWIEEYRIDGFRFDFTRGIGWDLNQPEFGILGWSSALKELDPTVYQIAEHLPASPYLIKNSDLDAGWHDSFHDKLIRDIWRPFPSMIEISKQVLGLYEYTNSGPNHYQDRTQAVKATVTHDEQSLIQEMVAFKGISLETALKRDLLYNALTFTSLGFPMIWQGQELGMQSGWFDSNNNGNWDEEKLSYRPMNWSLLNTERGQKHLEHTRRLTHLRKNSKALVYGKLTSLGLYEDARVIVYGYRDERDIGFEDEVMVVANFSGSDTTLEDIPWLSAGIWYDIFNDSQMTVPGTTLSSIKIPSYTALVYSNSLNIATQNDPVEIPIDYTLHQNYPNPFNPITTIRYDLPEVSNVKIVVYDILGREVETLVERLAMSGSHEVVWDASNIPSGVYLYQTTVWQDGVLRYKATKKSLLLK